MTCDEARWLVKMCVRDDVSEGVHVGVRNDARKGVCKDVRNGVRKGVRKYVNVLILYVLYERYLIPNYT